MKLIPLLFTSNMAIANINTLKTETRRTRGLDEINKNPEQFTFEFIIGNSKDKGLAAWFLNTEKPTSVSVKVKNYFGEKGDILWQRETFAVTRNINRIEDWPGRPFHIIEEDPDNGMLKECVIYAADGHWQWCNDDGFDTEKSYWKPSIHMKKDYCRFHAEIQSVSIERLHSITEKGAMAEGIQAFTKDGSVTKYSHSRLTPWAEMERTAFVAYKILWISIHGEASWNINPWVWVIKYAKSRRPLELC